MGKIAAVVVGLIAFLVTSISGSIVGAVAFGAVMFAMAYGAFAWRPGKKHQTHEVSPPLSPAPPTSATARQNSQIPRDFADKTVPSPNEVGVILGMSLIEDQSPDEVQPKELALVQAAGVSRADYVIERFLLRASAAAHAAGACLQPDQHREVAAGFMSWFERNATNSSVFAKTYQLFKERLPIYVEAGRKDHQQDQPDTNQLSFSQVSYVFGDALTRKSTNGAAGEGACRVLAMTVCDAYWSAQVEGSVALFRRAELLKLPRDA